MVLPIERSTLIRALTNTYLYYIVFVFQLICHPCFPSVLPTSFLPLPLVTLLLLIGLHRNFVIHLPTPLSRLLVATFHLQHYGEARQLSGVLQAFQIQTSLAHVTFRYTYNVRLILNPICTCLRSYN